jgi:NADH-quinone oxidoreductase subunit C
MGVESQAGNARDPSDVPALLVRSFPAEVSDVSRAGGEAVAQVVPGALHKVMEFLKDDPRLQFDVLLDVTAVDYLGREPRFEVVYHLLSLPGNRRLRVKTAVADGKPSLDSVSDLWKSADWLEREVWDMFGIDFSGHPNLKRILLYPEFQGHPLRKDYPIRRRQPLIGPKN